MEVHGLGGVKVATHLRPHLRTPEADGLLVGHIDFRPPGLVTLATTLVTRMRLPALVALPALAALARLGLRLRSTASSWLLTHRLRPLAVPADKGSVFRLILIGVLIPIIIILLVPLVIIQDIAIECGSGGRRGGGGASGAIAIHVDYVTTVLMSSAMWLLLLFLLLLVLRLVVGLTFLWLILLMLQMLTWLLSRLLMSPPPGHRVLIALVRRIWSERCVEHGHRPGDGVVVATGLQELLQRDHAIAIGVHFLGGEYQTALGPCKKLIILFLLDQDSVFSFNAISLNVTKFLCVLNTI